MAHECWECAEVCYCDMDDTWGLPQPKDCDHVCRAYTDNGLDEDDRYGEDELP
jgi:hypothetical protein